MPTTHFSGTLIIGAGPSGLMAADILSKAGVAVRIYEAMPTPGRKFLMAGRGGLNITHSEALDAFVQRYGDHSSLLKPFLNRFGPNDIINWMDELEQPSFIGSSGRVFPKVMKAAPLLRAWLTRLNQQGVELLTRHRWVDWDDQGGFHIESPEGPQIITADQIILATGGGSWKKLGSDGQWVNLLQRQGIQINPLIASNCGFTCEWSDVLRKQHAGTPIKGAVLKSQHSEKKGDLILTHYGLEGGLIYAFSADIRQSLRLNQSAKLTLDLMPDIELAQLIKRIEKPRGRNSFSNHLRKAGIASVKAALVRESYPEIVNDDPFAWAEALKNCPITLTGMRPIDEAISTAGGVSFSELDNDFRLKKKPTVFCAGEMIDWDAPTGGYLLTACFSIGVHIAEAIIRSNSEKSKMHSSKT